MLKVVLFCGGSGSASLVEALSRREDIQTTLIINPFDDGKSTGLLREKVQGLAGTSDFRKNIVNSSNWRFSKLLNIRIFDVALGNLIMAIIYIVTKDFQKTINWTASMFRAKVKILSITNSPAVLSATLENGDTLEKEVEISTYAGESKIVNLKVDGLNHINKECITALLDSDLIIYGSGTQHSSLFPTYMVLSGLIDIKDVSARKVYIENFAPDNDTRGWTRQQVIEAAAKYWGVALEDLVDDIIYAHEGHDRDEKVLDRILRKADVIY